MTQSITIEKAQASDRSDLVTLLKQVNLLTDDLPVDLSGFWLARQDGQLVGSVGLECWGQQALLRSLAVYPSGQGKGLGTKLYQAAMRLAQQQAIEEVYLITTTADFFFARQGFAPVDRSLVPDAIRQTAQFNSLCPSSAVVMVKKPGKTAPD